MRRALLGVTLSLALGLAACAPPSVDRYTTAQSADEVVSLLNERQYTKAVWLLEQRVGKEPSGQDAYLLAQAYLGRAGFEPLALAAAVMQPLPDVPAAKVLFPECPSGRLGSTKNVPGKCLLKRIYLRSPRPDQPDFARARYLLRRAYPDAAATPEWVNALIGVVETVSLVGRAGDVYTFAKAQNPATALLTGQAQLPWLKEQGKAAREEGRQAVSRAGHAGKKIAGLLSSSKADVWFAQVDGTVDYAEAVGLPRFLDFVRDHLLSASDEIRYGELLDRLRDLVAQEENTLNDTSDD